MTFTSHAGLASSIPGTYMPGSPPELTGSKSSKSSSFHSSYQSDHSTISEDAGNFEDIGLDDESRNEAQIGTFEVKTTSNPYDASFTYDLRNSANAKKRVPMAQTNGNRAQHNRELTATKGRPAMPSLRGQIRSVTDGGGSGLGLQPVQNGGSSAGGMRRQMSSPGVSAMMKRTRSSSPNVPRGMQNLSTINALKTRRGSWQANRERKTAEQLELECDEDDGDDVPDDCFLENVPMSPRPASERTKSMPPSAATSPERQPKERVRSIGNGTSPRPAEQGELRSPRTNMHRAVTSPPYNGNNDPTKARAKSWTAALQELNQEAKDLTEALEAHAEHVENDPMQRRSFNTKPRLNSDTKQRVKSAIAELPPLRRTEIMIDPHPISKEKEAVLSRTRPSWLPPKNPAEEKRHLKEYQKMMASALEAERKKEAQSKVQTTCRDDTASSLLRIWEEHVLPNWDAVTSQKRTRELWWRGIAPRSRGVVWQKAIGNQLGLSDSSYVAALRRAQALEKTIKRGSGLSPDEETKKGWLRRIEQDVEGTYKELRIFQKGGPLHETLRDVLRAYAMYRSDIGYVPGTSTIAALLLLNLPTPSSTFSALSNLLNRPLAHSFHTSDPGSIFRTYSLLFSTLKLKSPRLAKHLTSLNLEPSTYLGDMFTSLFTQNLSLDQVTRLWDVVVFEGDAVLVRAAVAYLVGLEGKLFGCESGDMVKGVVEGGLSAGVSVSEGEWMGMVRGAGKA
ncbi:related to Mac1p interacting protein (MIC1 protein) [Rhynchosporium graminicola]|uniref:Related to Mac1p interacting protein (MIC1 protein) n=1 Tax=Rhynchosporium graminicola TaxID=2792576 RepID=A0A1E1LCQ8_9HELO|nr:related to Mac1p interacting protein (MIC1 protein) [Rhynchosporium commune]